VTPAILKVLLVSESVRALLGEAFCAGENQGIGADGRGSAPVCGGDQSVLPDEPVHVDVAACAAPAASSAPRR